MSGISYRYQTMTTAGGASILAKIPDNVDFSDTKKV